MSDPVGDLIDRLKAKLSVSSDADLARSLGVDRSTIASWKARGKVPRRYSYIADDDMQEEAAVAPTVWGDLENAAFNVALFRFCLTHSEIVNRGEPRQMVAIVTHWHVTFWLSMKRAKQDLLAVLQDGVSSVEAAETMLLTEDLGDRAAAVQRDHTFMLAGLKRSLGKWGPDWVDRIENLPLPRFTKR